MTVPAGQPASSGVLVLSSARDVFALRRAGQAAAEALGLEHQDQVRLATALSELGRDRLDCTGLTAAFAVTTSDPPSLSVTLKWMEGVEPAKETLALASRLVHRVRYESGVGGERVVVEQPLPPSAASAAALRGRLRDALRSTDPPTLAEDLRAQTRDLIATLEETRSQRERLRQLNEELEETNRGVLALYTELSEELEETNSGVVALHHELEDKSRQIRETSEAKTRFWTNISHELRTPVNAVVAVSRLLMAEDGDSPRLDPEQRRQVSLIAASGSMLLELVGDLLDVAKAESGQLEVHRGPVDLRSLVGQLSAVLLSAFPVTKDVELVTPAPADLPGVVTDELLVTRILRNLLSNALKFTERGEVRLDVGIEAAEPQSWLTLTVTDTGVGIPMDEQRRVFEEFYQVRGPHQRGRPGTGLGLPYARTLSELLGGTLVLTSTPGAGTRVEVRIPADPVGGSQADPSRDHRSRAEDTRADQTQADHSAEDQARE